MGSPPTPTDAQEFERLRVGLEQALDALAIGDQEGAVGILQATLEPPRQYRCRCDDCGALFEWVGQLEAHARRIHEELA